MAEIAAELGMSKKTLYKAFPTKQQLAEALVDEIFEQINQRCDAILGSPAPALEKLLRILEVIVENQQRFATKIMIESLYHQLPHLWQRVEKFRRARMEKNLTSILDQARQEGTVRPGFNHELFLQLLRGAIRECLSAEVLMHASHSLQQALHGLFDLLLNGVLTPAGRKRYQRLHQQSLFKVKIAASVAINSR